MKNINICSLTGLRLNTNDIQFRHTKKLINHVFKIIIVLIVIFSLPGKIYCQSAYTFTLKSDCTTSAGVYKPDSILIKTLWSVKKYQAGTYNVSWDGKDDHGNQMPSGNYVIKVISNNINTRWQARVGNTSTAQNGSTVHRQFYDFTEDMMFAGNKVLACSGYAEGRPSIFAFSLDSVQSKINVFPPTLDNKFTHLCANDGVIAYFAGFDAVINDGSGNKPSGISGLFLSNNSAVNFTSGTNYAMQDRPVENLIGLIIPGNGYPSGLAVQKQGIGNYLFISRIALNRIDVYDVSNKTNPSGAYVRSISITNPKRLCTDAAGNLWVSYSTNTIEKFTVNSNGSLTTTGVVINGAADPDCIEVDPTSNRIAVIDYSTQQIKFFNASSGSYISTLGQAGGYLTNATVYNDKFAFADMAASNGKYTTTVRFNPADGSIWVGDTGNHRIQVFESNGTYRTTIMSLPPNYSPWVNLSDPTKIGAEWYGFDVDYSTPLTGSTGWAFTRNWAGQIPLNKYDTFQKIKSPHTFVIGGVTKTFCFLIRTDVLGFELVEMQANGVLRFTGIIKPPESFFDKDGNIISGSNRYAPLGFNSAGNIIFSTTAEALFTGQYAGDNSRSFNQNPVTASGKIIFYNAEVKSNGNYNTGEHLVAINKGHKPAEYMWATEYADAPGYSGDYPPPGIFEIGNSVLNGGSSSVVVDNIVITGYVGEFWKGGVQTNKYNMYDANTGLALLQFGIDGTYKIGEAPAMMAGNAYHPAAFKYTDGNIYLWHGDESYHAAMHNWKISGLNTIQEQDIPITYPMNVKSSDSIPGIDLLAGLPHQAIVVNGNVGWSRSIPEDYTSDSKYWTVQTGLQSEHNNITDMLCYYRQSSGVKTVNRDLGYNNTSNWMLTCIINSANNTGNAQNGGGGYYIEVLDDKGKIITRFYIKETYTSDFDHAYHVYGNDKVLVEGDKATVNNITSHDQPISIVAKNGAITFKYSNYSATTNNLIDASANYKTPTSFRVYFWTSNLGENYNRLVDIKALKFISNKIDQSINFDGIVSKLYGIAPFALTAWSSANLPVTYSIISGPAKIIGNILTITGSGKVVIQADQPGNDIYNPAASVTQNLIISPMRLDL